MKTVFAPLQLN